MSSSVGKICLYCSKPIAAADRVACCDRCYAAHHEECWERNGRCSTFRCAGVPKTMRGDDLAATLSIAFERANLQPCLCPSCGGKAYAGLIQGRKPGHVSDSPPGHGLAFIANASPNGRRGFLGRILPNPLRRQRAWWLPGAHIKARSCGRCRRLYIWGVPIDDRFLEKALEKEGERYCPHCTTGLAEGSLCLDAKLPGGARFECDEPPDLHKDWVGHNILDRFFMNKWSPTIASLPAHSCEECQYTEVAGRPIYRFL